jgi:hypothetical protein
VNGSGGESGSGNGGGGAGGAGGDGDVCWVGGSGMLIGESGSESCSPQVRGARMGARSTSVEGEGVPGRGCEIVVPVVRSTDIVSLLAVGSVVVLVVGVSSMVVGIEAVGCDVRDDAVLDNPACSPRYCTGADAECAVGSVAGILDTVWVESQHLTVVAALQPG